MALKRNFRRFPKYTKLRKKWIKAIDRPDYVPKDNNVVCEDHLIESDFRELTTARRINQGAVPSINIPESEENSAVVFDVSEDELISPPALQLIKTEIVDDYLPIQHKEIIMLNNLILIFLIVL